MMNLGLFNSERQVSSYGRTINFESYQLITFANRRQVWSIHTRKNPSITLRNACQGNG